MIWAIAANACLAILEQIVKTVVNNNEILFSIILLKQK